MCAAVQESGVTNRSKKTKSWRCSLKTLGVFGGSLGVLGEPSGVFERSLGHMCYAYVYTNIYIYIHIYTCFLLYFVMMTSCVFALMTSIMRYSTLTIYMDGIICLL